MRVRINIEYDGTKYVGWQKQKNGKSIQGEIEACLLKLYKEEIKLFVAGRTDSGVHAIEQVAHFDTNNNIWQTYEYVQCWRWRRCAGI